MIANLRARLPKPSPWLAWLAFLGLFLAAGAFAGVMVLWKGLSLTNLTDLVPWGLWITIDLSSIALAAGAFSLCAAVYLIGLKRYQPIARTATFVGLIGYSMAMLCLFMDIGRPFKFYQALIYWNTHSLLWEVTMCVILYFTVLLLESMPIIANWEWLRKKFPKLTAKMSHVHHFAPYLAIAGLFLSSLHQSSLGGGLWCAQGAAFLVQTGNVSPVHALGHCGRHFHDALRFDAGLPPDIKSKDK